MRGGSWTEPTVYAMLALDAAGRREAAERGRRWIASAVRPDGGWPPRPDVEESTWVTGLVALLPPELLDRPRYEGAIEWLLRTTGRESDWIFRVREFLPESTPSEQVYAGWPWVPGAAAWVGPTSLAMLALRRAGRQRQWPHLDRRMEEGRQFLLSHVCQEGGWNHGSMHPLGYEADAYPETTGMALAALAGVESPAVERAIAAALRFLDGCRSADALNWLRLGLAAHGRMPAGYAPAAVEYRTTPEMALGLMVEASQGNRLVGA